MSGSDYNVVQSGYFSYDFSSGTGYLVKGGLSSTKQNLLQGAYPPSQLLGGSVSLMAPQIDANSQMTVVCLDESGNVISGQSAPSTYLGNGWINARYTFTQPLPAGSKISWQINSTSLAGIPSFISCLGNIVA